MASFAVPATITGEQLLRFAQGLEGVASSMPTNKVLDGTVSDELGVPADLHEAGRVVGVDDQKADPGIAKEVAPFLTLEGGVDRGALAVEVDPHEARLRLAVRTHGREDAEDRDRSGEGDRQHQPPVERGREWRDVRRRRERGGSDQGSRRDAVRLERRDAPG